MGQDLVTRLRERARIRRQIPTRKSVQEGEPDRISDLLEEAASELSKPKIIFVVEFLRYNNREKHTYLGGIFKDELEVLAEAWAHMKMRAGKYGAEITGFNLENNEEVYKRTLDCWDAFAESSKDLAEKVRQMLKDDSPEADMFNPEGVKVEEYKEKQGD